tara:strand:- start:345 stop:701 length:357 start_codon:yes stop_codon:yes gene_type:complete
MTDKLPKVGDMTLGEYKAKMNSFFQSINKLAENIEKIQKPVKPTSEWQPIETAPKDGTLVLLFEGIYGGCINTGYWGKHYIMDKKEVWCSNGCVENYQTFDKPSFWMPLPKPPVDNNK